VTTEQSTRFWWRFDSESRSRPRKTHESMTRYSTASARRQHCL